MVLVFRFSNIVVYRVVIWNLWLQWISVGAFNQNLVVLKLILPL